MDTFVLDKSNKTSIYLEAINEEKAARERAKIMSKWYDNSITYKTNNYKHYNH